MYQCCKSVRGRIEAFSFFAAQAAIGAASNASESGAAGGVNASGVAVSVKSPSDVKDLEREPVDTRTAISCAELRHVLQNIGERMSPEHVDTTCILACAATRTTSLTGSDGIDEIDYVLLARELLT